MKTVIAIIESRWQAESYLRIAKTFPDEFESCGFVSQTKAKRDELIKKWKVKVCETLELLLLDKTPDFIVVSIAKEKAHMVIINGALKPIIIRSPRIVIRGDREKICNLTVEFIKEF
jgi:hypothetical protein